jgi:flagellar protein FliO/FliZ
MKTLAAVSLLIWSGLSMALDPGQPSTLTQDATVSRASYLEATGGLILVILLIFGLGWVVKRLGMVPGSKGMVRILGGTSLGGRERALILEVEGRRVLVGVAPGQVNLLLHLEETDTAPRPELKQKSRGQAKVEPNSQAFAEALAEANTQIESKPTTKIIAQPPSKAE